MPSPQKLNMRKMYNAFIKIDDGKTRHLYFADDLGIVVDIQGILSPFVFDGQGPYLIEDYRLVVCRKGSVRTIVNLQELTIEEGMMAVIMPGFIVEPISVSDDFTVTGVGVSEERMRMAHGGQLPDILCTRRKSNVLQANNSEVLLAEQLFAMMWNLANQRIVKGETLDSMLSVITHAYDDIFQNHEADIRKEAVAHSRQHELFQDFISLINEHCRSERGLDFYADRLCITRRHLGSVVHEVSGVTAKEWIDRATITLAKVMLRHTTKNISQISDELHFPNDSFFCKYFKRLTGHTPLGWRNGA
jgi:AraC family transcriptional regulator, transcriptional activator of pobA